MPSAFRMAGAARPGFRPQSALPQMGQVPLGHLVVEQVLHLALLFFYERHTTPLAHRRDVLPPYCCVSGRLERTRSCPGARFPRETYPVPDWSGLPGWAGTKSPILGPSLSRGLHAPPVRRLPWQGSQHNPLAQPTTLAVRRQLWYDMSTSTSSHA